MQQQQRAQQQHWQQQLQQLQQWIQQQHLALQQQWNQQQWNKQQQQQDQQQEHRHTTKDALGGNLRTVTLYPYVRYKYDMLTFFVSPKADIIHHNMQYLTERRGLKYSLNLQVKCYKEKDGEKI